MSDFTTADQRLPGAAVNGRSGESQPLTPLSFHDALSRWELAKEQAEESRLGYLDCKNFGNATSMFTAAVVYAEAANIEAESRVLFEGIADDEYAASLQAEREDPATVAQRWASSVIKTGGVDSE